MKKLYRDAIWLANKRVSARKAVYKTDDGKTVILLDGELVEVRPDKTGFYSTKWES